MIAYTLTNNSITVVLNNKVYTVNNGQPQWEQVLTAIRENDEKELFNVLTIANSITSFTEGNVTVKDNQVFYRGQPLDNYVVEKVLTFAKNKLPLQPILRFINNLMKNPSRRAVQELYKFLEHKSMPITPDGNFLAYKGVQSDYYSKTAGSIIVVQGKVLNGRIFNGIGEVIEVERNGVCDDKNVGCSSGLHAGSVKYATDFGAGGKVVLVEINPADVVSVPDDCNCQKLRTCKYKVVGEYEVPLNDDYHNVYSNEDWNNANSVASDDEYEDYNADDYDSDHEPHNDSADLNEKSFIESATIQTEQEKINSTFNALFTDNGKFPPVKKEITNPAKNIADAAEKLREFAATISNVVSKANEPKQVTVSEEDKIKAAIFQLTEALKTRLSKL